MREKIIEEKLIKAVQQNGGVCWKFTSPGTAGDLPRKCTARCIRPHTSRHATPGYTTLADCKQILPAAPPVLRYCFSVCADEPDISETGKIALV